MQGIRRANIGSIIKFQLLLLVMFKKFTVVVILNTFLYTYESTFYSETPAFRIMNIINNNKEITKTIIV